MGKKTKAFRGPNDGNKKTYYCFMNEANSFKFPNTVRVGHKVKRNT